MSILLTRDEFRKQVFHRDQNACVVCKRPGQDAHHIVDRKLWPNGGYYLDNGATVCAECHLLAEQNLLTCDDIRSQAGIKTILLPPGWDPFLQYDKWGKIMVDGSRVKYPKTYHVPWSPGTQSDDRFLEFV